MITRITKQGEEILAVQEIDVKVELEQKDFQCTEVKRMMPFI
jgi:hypothetical protein